MSPRAHQENVPHTHPLWQSPADGDHTETVRPDETLEMIQKVVTRPHSLERQVQGPDIVGR